MGWKAFQEVQERWRGPTEGLRGVGRPSRRSRRGQEALLQVRKGVGRPSRRFQRDREALPVVREG